MSRPASPQAAPPARWGRPTPSFRTGAARATLSARSIDGWQPPDPPTKAIPGRRSVMHGFDERAQLCAVRAPARHLNPTARHRNAVSASNRRNHLQFSNHAAAHPRSLPAPIDARARAHGWRNSNLPRYTRPRNSTCFASSASRRSGFDVVNRLAPATRPPLNCRFERGVMRPGSRFWTPLPRRKRSDDHHDRQSRAPQQTGKYAQRESITLTNTPGHTAAGPLSGRRGIRQLTTTRLNVRQTQLRTCTTCGPRYVQTADCQPGNGVLTAAALVTGSRWPPFFFARNSGGSSPDTVLQRAVSVNVFENADFISHVSKS